MLPLWHKPTPNTSRSGRPFGVTRLLGTRASTYGWSASSWSWKPSGLLGAVASTGAGCGRFEPRSAFHFEDELVARLGRKEFPVPAYQYTMKSGETRWVRDALLRPDGIFSIEYL